MERKKLVWHWLTVNTYGKKYWCGTDWQLSPVGGKMVWHWRTVIIYGKNIGVAWTELSTVETNWCDTDWQLSPMEKNKIGVALTDSCQLWKKHIDVALTDSYHLWEKYWCGTDQQLSPMEKLMWHWLTVVTYKNFGAALTGSCQLCGNWLCHQLTVVTAIIRESCLALMVLSVCTITDDRYGR